MHACMHDNEITKIFLKLLFPISIEMVRPRKQRQRWISNQ
jgi:hypothetical protein